MGTAQFGSLFKKYRLRSEIETLAEFGNLLADEGMIYETSLFTKWQKGNRIPKDRKTLLSILRVFTKKGGIRFLHEANEILEAAGQGYATENEIANIPALQKIVPFQVPRRIEHFIGRISTIEKASSQLIFGKTVLIYGQPGIGKSVLASDIGHQVSKYFSDGVLWYQLNTAPVMDILASIAELYGHNIRNIQDITIRSSIIRSITARKKILFIFDNLDKEEDLAYLIPNTPSCGALITSIHPCITSREIDERVLLQPFTKEETLILFEQILGEQYLQKNKNEILQLYKLVDGLPLALHVLAKQIFYYKKPIKGIIDSIFSTKTNLAHFSYENKNLYSVLQVCYARLNIHEQKILNSTAAFDGKDFSVDAIAAVNSISKKAAERQLEFLWNYSLIEQSEPNRYRLHPFIRIFLLNYIDPLTYTMAAKFYYEAIKKKTKTLFTFFYKELENILPLINHSSLSDSWPYVAGISQPLCDYLWNAGQWDKLKKISHYLYTLSDNHNDVKLKIYICLIPLSLVYYWRNDTNKAEHYIQEAYSMAMKINDPYLIHLSKQRLGRMLIGTKKMSEASALLHEAALYFSSQSDAVQSTLTHINLGEISLRNRNISDALAHFQNGKLGCEKIVNISMKNICLSEILFYLGAINIIQKKWDAAKINFFKGLSECKKINEYSEISTTGYIGLGLCYEQEKKLLKSKECFYKAREQIEFLGIKHSLIDHDTFFYTLRFQIQTSNIFKSLYNNI